MSVSITDVTSTEYLVVDADRLPVLAPFGEGERGLAFAESHAINKWRAGTRPPTHVEVRITHTRVEQYAVKG